MNFSEETLMAYADNELDAQTRLALEEAMATDPALARRVAQHKALRGKLSSAFDQVLHEKPPQRLVDAARGAPAVKRENNVIPLRRKQPPRRTFSGWISLAASALVGMIIGQFLKTTPDSPIASHDGKLLASGALAQGLTEQLAGTSTTSSPVRIGVSFKSKVGSYCRTFTMEQTAGLACREHDDWRVQVLTQGTATDANNYRQAGSALPRAVLEAVDASIAGDPLDAHAEAAARDKRWATP